MARASPPAAPMPASPQSKPLAVVMTRTTGVRGIVKLAPLRSGPTGLAVAVAGASAPRASARAVAFLRWWLGSMMLCLLWFGGRPVRPDRRQPSARTAKERLGAVTDRSRRRLNSLLVGVKRW